MPIYNIDKSSYNYIFLNKKFDIFYESNFFSRDTYYNII